MKRRHITCYVIVFILLITLAAALLPLKYPYKINTHGRIYPARRWALVRNSNGQLVSSMFDYRTGISSGYDLASFSGNGHMRFSFDPKLSDQNSINQGDTLGRIYSSETEEEIISLTGQLEIARASLAVYSSGENLPRVEELEREVDYVGEEIISQKIILNRQKSLLEADLITREDYEIEETNANLLNIKNEIAMARLKTAHAGEKPELLDLANRQIQALENQILTLRDRQNSYIIISPLDGRVAKYNSVDTLLTVFDTDSIVAVFPIESGEFIYFQKQANPAVTLDLNFCSRIGRLINLGSQVEILDNHAVIYATALFEGGSDNIMPGMLCRCLVIGEDINLFELAKRNLESLLR